MEQLGTLEIKQYGGANLKAELSFKSAGWNNKDLHRIEGFIVDQEWVLTFSISLFFALDGARLLLTLRCTATRRINWTGGWSLLREAPCDGYTYIHFVVFLQRKFRADEVAARLQRFEVQSMLMRIRWKAGTSLTQSFGETLRTFNTQIRCILIAVSVVGWCLNYLESMITFKYKTLKTGLQCCSLEIRTNNVCK